MFFELELHVVVQEADSSLRIAQHTLHGGKVGFGGGEVSPLHRGDELRLSSGGEGGTSLFFAAVGLKPRPESVDEVIPVFNKSGKVHEANREFVSNGPLENSVKADGEQSL